MSTTCKHWKTSNVVDEHAVMTVRCLECDQLLLVEKIPLDEAITRWLAEAERDARRRRGGKLR